MKTSRPVKVRHPAGFTVYLPREQAKKIRSLKDSPLIQRAVLNQYLKRRVPDSLAEFLERGQP